MTRKIHLMEITQPVGTFYIGKINSDVLIDIAEPNRRKGNEGVQRSLSKKEQ